MTIIQARLERLLEFMKKLKQLLAEEKYAQFHQQQALFGDLLRDFLKKHSSDELVTVVDSLNRLKSEGDLLQESAANHFQHLKDQSLALQRNKKSIKAYQ